MTASRTGSGTQSCKLEDNGKLNIQPTSKETGHMRKAIGIGVMAALVVGLGLSVPATVYADDSMGQADETVARKNDGIYSVKVDGKELIKGDAVSESTPIYYFSNTEPKQIVAAKSFSAGVGSVQLPLRNIAQNEMSNGSTVVTGKIYKPDGGSPFYVIWAKAGDFFKNMKISYNGSEAEINLYDSDKIESSEKNSMTYQSFGTAKIHTAIPKEQAEDFFAGLHIPEDLKITGIPDGWKVISTTGMSPQVNANTDEYTANITYATTIFPNNEYTVKITFVNDGTPQAQQPTQAQPTQAASDTAQAPQLVQTGIEQAPLIALSAAAAAGTTAYAIRKKRSK